jgi:hypothetical protein
MTMLNILMEPQRARVVVDSLTHDGHRRLLKRHDGTPLTATKMVALPDINALLAVSGRLALLPELHRRIQSVSPRDLDELLSRMPDILAHLGRTLSTARDTPYRGDVVHLVGWSNQAHRMLGRTWSTSDGFLSIDDESRIGEGPLEGILQPPVGRLGRFPETDAQLLSLARQQVQHAEAKLFGGTLFAAEVTRLRIDIRSVGELGVPPGPSVEKAEVAHATVLNRMQATWTGATDPGILDSNGGFEIRYGLANLPDSQWTSIFVDGSVTKAYLPDVLFDRIYVVKIRGFNAISTGNWSPQVTHKVGGVNLVVDTPQLAPNAATVYAKVTPSNGTRNTSTYSGPAATLFAAHATLNYVNSSAAAVEVEVFGSFTWWVSTAAAGYVIGASFQGTNGASNITDANNVGITGTSAPTPVSYSRSFTVAPGDTLSLNLSSWFKTAGSGASGGVFNWTDMVLKYNVLKR